ncbi:MAG: GTP-binding protein [Candidatus Heimdallarchaeota archaeon]|nr:GTP-binding protein [Candidatus Heimdallarchaeota archaeon]
MFRNGREQSKVVLFCGLSNAGKTTILNIFTKGDVSKTAPTIGISLDTLTFDDVNFRIFDLGGQKKFREQINHLLPFTDVLIFVVDGKDKTKEKLAEIKNEFQSILKKTQKRLTPICVLRHKSDLSHIISEEKLTQTLGLNRTLDRTWKLITTSAVTLEGLQDLFEWVYEQVVGRQPQFKIQKKLDQKVSFHYPCPMMREVDEGITFCLNQDEFIETQLLYFGFEQKVNKMLLEVLPELRKESLETTGKDICPDFCILEQGNNVLKCPVTGLKIETRGITVDLERYENALALSQIYGAKIGEDVCRECFYKIITSPECILTQEELQDILGKIVHS